METCSSRRRKRCGDRPRNAAGRWIRSCAGAQGRRRQRSRHGGRGTRVHRNRRRSGDLREFGDAKLIAFGQDDGAEITVFELPDIAGPVVRKQCHAQHETRGWACLPRREAREEVPRQPGNVLAPLAQRRQRDPEHVQPVMRQVLAEPARLDVGDQVPVASPRSSGRRPCRASRADRLDFTVLQRAQQLDLRRQRQFADLIEKQRAAVRFDEFADVLLGGAGEGAFLVTEQE